MRQVFSDHDLIPLTHADLEVTDRKQTEETLDRLAPELILNTAAYHRVDECEETPAKAYEVNALAVRHLAQWSAAHQAALLHVSTDYVAVPRRCLAAALYRTSPRARGVLDRDPFERGPEWRS